jgi:hypothetical protein
MKNSILIIALIATSLVTSCTKQKFFKAVKEETFVKTTGPAYDTTLSIFAHVNTFKISDKKSLYIVSDVDPLYGVTFRSEPSSDPSTHNFVSFEKIKGSKEFEMVFDKQVDWSQFTEGTANLEALKQSKFFVKADDGGLILRHVCPGYEETFVFTKQ